MDIYQKGDHPKLLLMSGTHGDEGDVISSVKKSIEKYSVFLPDYLYIPEVSPSAVKLGTRTNEDGRDLNRSFFEDSPIPEVRSVMELIKPHRFDTCVSFHEDPEGEDFYLYDAFGPNLEGSSLLGNFQNEIKSTGINLLNGIDDPSDPTLGNIFHDGYLWWPPVKENPKGFSCDWAFAGGYIKRYLNPEIPGKLPTALKDQLVDIFFKHFIILQ